MDVEEQPDKWWQIIPATVLILVIGGVCVACLWLR